MHVSSPISQLSRPFLARAAAGAALLLAALTLLASLTPLPALGFLFLGENTVVFDTIICIILLSSATLARLSRQRVLASVLFAIALVIASIVTLEHALRLGSVIDERPLRLTIVDHNRYPGRMSINSCLAVAMLAIAGLLQAWSPARRTAQVARILCFLAGGIGALGIFGLLFALDFLYHSVGLVQIAPVAGVLFGLMAMAVRLSGVRPRRRQRSDDFRLNRVAGVVVVAVAAVTGLASFGLMQRRLESTLGDNLNDRLTERAGYLASALYDYRTRADLTTNTLSLAQDVERVVHGDDAISKTALYTFIHELMPSGFSAIAFVDLDGDELASLGEFHSRRAVKGIDLVPVSLTSDADKLGWDHGFYLYSRRELRLHGELIGYALDEQPLASVARLTELAGAIGTSTEVSLCSVAGVEPVCFPTRLHERPFQLDPALDRVESALVPRSRTEPAGMMRSSGREGEPLLAAFRPVAGTSLVMIMTSDLSDVYAPVRNAFQSVLPLIILLALGGIAVVQWFVRPLIAQLLLARRAAEDSESRFRAAAEGSLDALYLLEPVRDSYFEVRDFRIVYANAHGERLLAMTNAEMRAITLADVLPQIRTSGWFKRYLRVLETSQPISGNVMVRLPGMKGTWIHQHVAPLGDGLAVTVRDISAQRATEEKLRHAAQSDVLTGLPNRALLLDRIERALLRSVRLPNAIALLYLDLDGFKGINDHYGHAAGDAVLIEFSKRLSKAVRAEDTVARLGGDEFCILVENLSGRAEAFRIADALLLSARVPISTPGQTLRITTSIGIAFGQGAADTAARFLGRADSALYQVKRRGRNGYFGEEAPESPIASLTPPGLAST